MANDQASLTISELVIGHWGLVILLLPLFFAPALSYGVAWIFRQLHLRELAS